MTISIIYDIKKPKGKMKKKVYYYINKTLIEKEEEIIEEAPLRLRINNEIRYMLRTPISLEEDKALIIGSCFTEGLIRNKDDILALNVEEGFAEIRIRQRKENKIKEDVIDQILGLSPTKKKKDKKISVNELLSCIDIMESRQRLRKKTKASHAAMLFSYKLESLYISEDIGRHNALDKIIGKAILEDKLDQAFLVTLSSRVSFEMAKKAALAGVKIIMAISRPTSMAISLAENAGISIVSLAKEGGVIIFTCRERIKICQKEIFLD